MSSNTRRIEATPEQVWDILSDGWLYPLWVVGATRMRAVDETWPAEASRLHHSLGVWPAVLDDQTEVLRSEPPSLLELRANGWPGGSARVTLRLTAVGDATEVEISEDIESGPVRLVPSLLRHPALGWRNVESLRRLAFLTEGRLSHRRRGPAPE